MQKTMNFAGSITTPQSIQVSPGAKKWRRVAQRTAVISVSLIVDFFGCSSWTQSTDLCHILQNISLILRVLAPLVVIAEEGENADDHAHHHKQCQGNPKNPPADGDLGTKSTEERDGLLHPPVKITRQLTAQCWIWTYCSICWLYFIMYFYNVFNNETPW